MTTHARIEALRAQGRGYTGPDHGSEARQRVHNFIVRARNAERAARSRLRIAESGLDYMTYMKAQMMQDNPTAPAVTPQRAQGFNRVSTEKLLEKEFAPIQWVIPDYVPEGLTLLAGKQKLGKTWLAIDWAAAVASGGFTMGEQASQGDVLYIDMENGDRRVQRRIQAMWPFKPARPNLSRLEWTSASPEIGPAFFKALDDWHDSVEQPRLVVIDVLQRIKPAGKAARNAYENDYAALTQLQQWATRNGVAVVALHHLRKGGSAEDDPFEKLSGSNGLSACADTTLVLDRSSQGVTLYGRGRDVEEIENAVVFDKSTFRWIVQGDVTDVRRSSQRDHILNALKDSDEPMSPAVIADVIGAPKANVRQLLITMAKSGEVQKSGRGQYIHPDNNVVTHTPDHNDHNDHNAEEHTPHHKSLSPSLLDVEGQSDGDCDDCDRCDDPPVIAIATAANDNADPADRQRFCDEWAAMDDSERQAMDLSDCFQPIQKRAWEE